MLYLVDGLPPFWDPLASAIVSMGGVAAMLGAVWGRAPRAEDTDTHSSAVPTGLLNYIDGAVLVVDSTYRIEHFNEQVHAFFPEQEIEQGAVLPRAFADALPESGTHTTLTWPLGADTVVRVFVRAVRGPDGISRVLTLRDVTETAAHEAALRGTDRLLRAIVETDVAAIAVVNEQGRVTYANAEAESLLGLQPTEEGQDAPHGMGAWRYKQLGWRMDPLDDAGSTQTPLRDVIDTQEPIRDLRCKVTWPDGGHCYLSLNAAYLPEGPSRPPQVVFAMKDITARYRGQRELQASMRRYADTRDAMPALFYMSDRTGNARFWNDTLRTYTGYSDDDLAGSALPHFFHPDDRLRIRKAINAVFAEQDAFGVAARLQAKDGTLYPCMLNGTVRTIDGTDYLLAVGLDVSEQGAP